MSITRPAMWAAALLLLAAAAPQAPAQRAVHRCDVNGRTVLSDRPCSTEAAMGAYGPSRPAAYGSPGTPYPAAVPRAPEHLQYLSAECAQLNDAIRTAPARGLRGNVINDLHADYRRRCGEDDSQARNQQSRDESQAREAARAQRNAEQADRARQRQQTEACAEMLRIVQARRDKAKAANAGERADLERFEANYHDRCVAR